MESSHPDLGAGVEASFGKNDQAPLRIVEVVIPALQQDVETTTPLFGGCLDGRLARRRSPSGRSEAERFAAPGRLARFSHRGA